MKNCLICLGITLFLTVSCQNNTIPPGTTPDGSPPPPPAHTTPVTSTELSQFYEAVGTIRPLTESVLEARVGGQILKIHATAGERVEMGQCLVELDGRSLKARLRQAREGESAARNGLNQALKAVDEARAGQERARADYQRTQTLFEKHVVPSQKLDLDKSAFLQAQARLAQSRKAVDVARSRLAQAGEVVREADIALEYTRIKAPAAGVVVKRHVDPGDQALPGKPLMVLQTSGALRLEAQVREGMMAHIRKGAAYPVVIQTAQREVMALVDEVVPYADPQTRTFIVKAALPQTPGVYPGMFGRLRIPTGKTRALMVPANALTRVGQLETVLVKSHSGFSRIYVTTGKVVGGNVEILSGLNDSDVVGW
ncbi:MAG: efflux RND transporter periplasmic adaptor subunit [Desulfobacterales bacterium]|nr:efflux RND transporter periplasmic adaptor subunit [Desulfobacterales bacterium]